MLTAALVSPLLKTVIPICPEPIIRQVNESKNDCEHSAALRLLDRFRKDHPKLKTIVLGDSLYSDSTIISRLIYYQLSYILTVKSEDHEYLFKQFEQMKMTNANEYHQEKFTIGDKKKKQMIKEYCFINDLVLFDSQPMKVNVLDFKETITWVNKDGENCEEKVHFSWITDIKLSKGNVAEIATLGMCRWRIENETINTLKNHGYHFEHNYGHGLKNLSINLSLLMMLAFFVDQILETYDKCFQAVLKKAIRKSYYWKKIMPLVEVFEFKNWETFFNYYLNPQECLKKTIINSS